ncbi:MULTISPECIES: hypothetical protein [Leptolyngbya]|uniref:hypothetical protein n=1 Tax=Leptolyngbya TaxID=47251 RepID=UPI001681E56E|nr:hypothetical protein [Leptolyngbya sp. FACHB-1624]MBD1859755.1 hypothetical protein [Leptolyngbya sp. FACHB-1624]
MTLSLAYISQGKLFLKYQDAPVQEVESQFGLTVQERKLRMERNKAWKPRGLQEMMLPPGLKAQLQQQPESVVGVEITSLCQGDTEQLLYALNAGDVGGIFLFQPKRQREDRLFHTADFQVGHLNYDRDRKLIACTTNYQTGISNIAVMQIDAPRPREVTEGDSIDLAPRWVLGKEKALVYQSAGIGRDHQGYVSDRAPFTIEKLDFEKQDVLTLASDPKSDLLSPQLDADGWLYYIRRPYSARQRSFNFLQFLKEIFLIPVRLLHAIFQWLNFFSQIYTGKPLMNAVTKQKIEQKQLQAWGEWVTPEMLRDRNLDEPDAPSLVPKTWQLVRQRTQGVPENLAEGVLSYDLAADGTVIYSNGSAIYMLSPNGSRERVLVGNWIEGVALLQP